MDNKGSTALHWASFLGSENAVSFLASWGAKLNIQDDEGGLTALHLAVTSGNAKIVHKLLLHGANKNLLDFTQKTPMDTAEEQELLQIKDLLEDDTCLEKFLKTGVFKSKPVKTRTFLYIFILMMLGLKVGSILFIYPCKTHIRQRFHN